MYYRCVIYYYYHVTELTNTAYQKQQDTMIVWSEADNYDLALSFQEKAGCDEIWERICQVKLKPGTYSCFADAKIPLSLPQWASSVDLFNTLCTGQITEKR